MIHHSRSPLGSQRLSQKLQITHSTLIHADPSRIYHALSTSEGLNSWFTTSSTVNAVPDGEIVFRWEDWVPDHITVDDHGVVLEAIPEKRFVFKWHPDLPAYATTVDIQIEPADDGTIVRLREHGYSDSASALVAMLNCATGWGEALTLLKFYLELGAHY
jgi:uncharacterized protein YndB with AHSA1/START domain